MKKGKKYTANETRASIFLWCVIGGETWLHDFGGGSIFYLSDIHFEQIAD